MNVELQTVERRDAGGVLTAMLQQQERVIKPLIDGFVRKKGNNAAHGWNLGKKVLACVVRQVGKAFRMTGFESNRESSRKRGSMRRQTRISKL